MNCFPRAELGEIGITPDSTIRQLLASGCRIVPGSTFDCIAETGYTIFRVDASGEPVPFTYSIVRSNDQSDPVAFATRSPLPR